MEDIRKPALRKLLRGQGMPDMMRNKMTAIPQRQPVPEVPYAFKAPSQVTNTKPKMSNPLVSSAKRLGLPANMPSAPIGANKVPNITKPLDMLKPDGLRRPAKRPEIDAIRKIIKGSGKQGSY